MTDEILNNLGQHLNDFYDYCRENDYLLSSEYEAKDGNIKTQCLIANQNDEEAVLYVELNHRKSEIVNDMNKHAFEVDLTVSFGSITMDREELNQLQTIFENISGMKMNEVNKAD